MKSVKTEIRLELHFHSDQGLFGDGSIYSIMSKISLLQKAKHSVILVCVTYF